MRVIKFLFFVMLIMFIVFKNVDKPYAIQNKVLDYDYLSNEMIRFHVIANSNSDFDQMVKNKIKDEVLNYFKENENFNFSENPSMTKCLFAFGKQIVILLSV